MTRCSKSIWRDATKELSPMFVLEKVFELRVVAGLRKRAVTSCRQHKAALLFPAPVCQGNVSALPQCLGHAGFQSTFFDALDDGTSQFAVTLVRTQRTWNHLICHSKYLPVLCVEVAEQIFCDNPVIVSTESSISWRKKTTSRTSQGLESFFDRSSAASRKCA